MMKLKTWWSESSPFRKTLYIVLALLAVAPGVVYATVGGVYCDSGTNCTMTANGMPTVLTLPNGTHTLAQTDSPTFTGTVTAAAATLSSTLTTNITGSTQCVTANSSGVLSGTGSTCGSGGSSTTILNVVSTAATTRTSSTALTAITGLSATVVAGTTYTVDIFIPYTAGASGGLKMDIAGGSFTLTSSGTMLLVPVLNDTAFASGTGSKLTAIASVYDAGASSFPTDGYVEFRGTIKVGSTGGGTLIPRIAQSVSSATSTIALAGASMTLISSP